MPVNLYRPAAYHGAGRRGPYFEGWYYKLVDAEGARRMAIIPGLFLGESPAASHAFIQTLDGVSGRTTYHRYPLDAFRAHPHAFAIEVGRSRFSLDGMALDIEGEGERIAGTIRLGGVVGWPVTWRAPGIMGWYSFVPFMECYHGVLGFDHTLEGLLAVDGEAVDFHGGRGYLEKDWGQAFPRAWIWMQSNHFGAPGVCLTASVARIPWLGTAFRGFIVGLWVDGALYRFATYTGATVEELEVTRDSVHWTLCGPATVNPQRRRLRLEIVAHRTDEQLDLLHAPARVAMLQRVLESLTAAIDVRLSEVESGRILFAGRGIHAGLELGGDLKEIL